MERSKELQHMWSRQASFNKNFVDLDHLDFDKKQEMTKEYVLHMLSEANSLLDGVNWKIHHKKELSVKRSDLILEMIDVWKYLLSIALIWGVTPEEFSQAFDEKSALVEQRYLQEFATLDGRKIVVCDIDGVLGDYPYTFLEFVRSEEYDVSPDDPPNFSSTDVHTLDLYKYLEGEVPSSRLKYYKHVYRQSGRIRQENVVEGAKEFLKSLRDKGYYIVLLTSRPFDTYKSLYLDTYTWLISHGLEFDALLNDSKKRDKVSKLLETSDVKFVVDDDPKLIANLEGLDRLQKLYLIDRPYNQKYECSGKVERVGSLSEILSKI